MNNLQDTITTAQEDLQERNPLPDMSSIAAPQYPLDNETAFQQKKQREAVIAKESSLTLGPDGVRLGGYASRVWSQDGIVEGLLAHSVGYQMQPDNAWLPFQPDNWKMLTDGIPEQFHNEFLNTTSLQHALYTKDLILKKLDEMQHLGDLGTAGNVGRLAFGLIEPTNLLAGIASAGVTTALKAGKTVAKAQSLINQTAKLEAGVPKLKTLAAATEALTEAATKDKGIGAIAAGIGSYSGAGYGFERLRQSVNFEDDQAQAIEAGLISLAFASPFIGLHAREMNRLAATAGKELQVLKALHKVHEGDELTPKDHANLNDFKATQEKVSSLELTSLKEQELGPIERSREGEYIPYTPPKEPLALPHGSIKGVATRAEPSLDTQRLLSGPEGIVKGKNPDNLTAATRKLLGNTEESSSIVDTSSSSEIPKATEGENITSPKVSPSVHPSEKLQGKQVFFSDAAGEFTSGTVRSEAHSNKLLIEDDHTGKLRMVSREDLHPDSPGFISTDAPEGFLNGSVGAAQAAPIKRGVDPTYMANGRMDIYKTLNQSPNAVIQELSHLLIKDAIGNSKIDAQGWSASERKRHYTRTIGGYFHNEAQAAFTDVNSDQNPHKSMQWARI